ncbi:hypothetical protein DL765_007345 [Monosporascus sp. GIB2]|nr:hypothetical protein DL765_007345 [Monosporascus sp. GIB2]
MLLNSTRPNIGGVNECLNKLCTGGYESLPYADADVVGIGVFSSYILQCLLLMLLWLGLYCFSRSNRKHSSTLLSNPHERPSETVQGVKSSGDAPLQSAGDTITHQSILETCLLQFHISQCYFSATIQIASLAYGIFSADMLLTFLLIPLSINGILPIVFGMLLLNQRGKASLDITLLSVGCWLLSSIVYWVLYSHIIDINSQLDTVGRIYMAYQQFSYKLSALDSCGGYSALAVCPNTFRAGREDVLDAAWKLSYVTPLIWAFSTITLVLILASMIRAWWEGEKDAYGTETENVHLRPHQISASPLLDPESARRCPATNTNGQQRGSRRTPFLSSGFAHRTYQSKTFHVVTTFLFLLALGIQLSLLSISTSLRMMSRHDWGFGQIVAVAVWVPPLLQYVYDELRVAVKARGSGRKKGRGRGRSECISLRGVNIDA